MFYYTFTTFDCNFIPRNAEICKVSSETKNVGKAHKYRLNRHLPTYEKIIKNLYSFLWTILYNFFLSLCAVFPLFRQQLYKKRLVSILQKRWYGVLHTIFSIFLKFFIFPAPSPASGCIPGWFRNSRLRFRHRLLPGVWCVLQNHLHSCRNELHLCHR